MPAGVTLEDVWATIRETDRQIQETSRVLRERSEETDRMLRERSEETDRRLRERSEETDRRLREGSEETDRKIREDWAETRRTLRDLSLQVDRTTRAVADLTGKWGKFVEGVVAPACETLFAERGIPVHQVFQRARARLGGRTMEIDVLVVDGTHVVLVEVKSTLKVQDVRDHLVRLAEFRSFFPVYADRKVLGGVAGMVIEEEADVFAAREGLFVLAQSGDTVCLLNGETFQPKAW